VFKVGDWVEVNAKEWWPHFHGMAGTVLALPTKSRPLLYEVHLTSDVLVGGMTLWAEDELLPTKSEELLALEVLGDEYFA
jgi:hypothetical protein